MKTNIFFLRLLGLYICSIGLSPSGELFELHDVTSESSSFIRENIFNLSEFFIQITWLCFHFNSSFLIEHVDIVGHKYCLVKFQCIFFNGWFTLDTVASVFRNGLHQCRDRTFSISLQKCNYLPLTHAGNTVMWMNLKLGHFRALFV